MIIEQMMDNAFAIGSKFVLEQKLMLISFDVVANVAFGIQTFSFCEAIILLLFI